MIFIKNLNGKAVVSEIESEDNLMLPVGVYIAAAYVGDSIRFYGSEDEDGLIEIGSTISGSPLTTSAEAKAAIKVAGCLFLNGNQVTL